MVKKDKVKKPLKKRVKKVVKQTQTQKQTVVVNIDTKKAPIRRRRAAPTPRQQEPSGIARFIRMNEPPQTLMNSGALGMNVREPLKDIGAYSQMGLGEKTDEQRRIEMKERHLKMLDQYPMKSREPVDLGRETESEKATTLPEKVTRGRGRPRIEKTAEQKGEDKRRRAEKQQEKRRLKKEEKEREKKQNM